jgi:opacity protein-like surface antigen
LGFASPLSRISASDTGGNSGRNGETGVHLGTQYLYQNTPRLGTGVNLEYFNRSATSDFGLIPSAETNVYGGTFQILGVMKYSFTSYGSARPYFLGGVGMDHTSTVIDATPLPGFSWSDTGTWETRRLADDDHWGLATTARLGIDFSLIESMIATFEVGWMGIHNRAYQTTSAGKDLGLNDVTGNLRSLIVAMRWGWKF